MLPTFVNSMMIYAFTNLHDLSWGTKGADEVVAHNGGGRGGGGGDGALDIESVVMKQEREQQAIKMAKKRASDIDIKYRRFRTYCLVAWLMSNFIFIRQVGLLTHRIAIDTPHSY
jgi:chitin synthase